MICEILVSRPLTKKLTKFAFFSSISACLILIVAISTISLNRSIENEKVHNFCSIFSLNSNFSRLLKKSPSSSEISCLNGIKTISLMFIIYYHSTTYRMYFPFRHGDELQKWSQSFFIVLSLPILVENFLLISGLLAGLSIIRENFKFSCFLKVLSRYLRITPSMIFVLLVHTSIQQFLTHKAPYAFEVECCEHTWMFAVTHTQNIFNSKNMVRN